MNAGLGALNASFLSDLTAIENRISRANSQISSGIRVAQPSDDPAAVQPILHALDTMGRLTQTQRNLTASQVDAQSVDSALQNTSSLLDQLVSIGSRGVGSLASAYDRQALGRQVQSVVEQLVGVANTSANGSFLFGGDDSGSAPYSYAWGATSAATQLTAQANTRVISDANGGQLKARLSARETFDARDGLGNPTDANIFDPAFKLGQALLNDDPAGAGSALAQLKTATSHFGDVLAASGHTLNWILDALTSAQSRLTQEAQTLSGLRETDIPSAAVELSSSKVALEAALSAHGAISLKSLFDYLG